MIDLDIQVVDNCSVFLYQNFHSVLWKIEHLVVKVVIKKIVFLEHFVVSVLEGIKIINVDSVDVINKGVESSVNLLAHVKKD